MLSTGAICACDLASVHLFMLSSLCAHDLYLDSVYLSSLWLAVILGENQVMIYPYEHLLIPCLCIWWIRSIGSLPGTRYTLFQLLESNALLMQSCGLCKALHLQILDDLLRSPWFLMAEVLCVCAVLKQEQDELCVAQTSPLPGDSYLVDCALVLGFVILLYHLFFYSDHDTQGLVTLWLIPCIALLLLPSTLELCALICWNLSLLQLLSFGLPDPILCCPWLWTSTSVLWLGSVQTEYCVIC
jgi:hypothetical protein